MKQKVPALIFIAVFVVLLSVPMSLKDPVVVLNKVVTIKRVTILFGGDMLFDRSIRTVLRKYGGDFIFSCISPTLRQADIVAANLEGPITNNDSVSEGTDPNTLDNFRFTFDSSIAQLLYFYNIRLVNIGNNHIMNFGSDGLQQTKYWLDSAEVKYFGDDTNYATTVKGVPLVFINYNEFGNIKHPHILEYVRVFRGEGYQPVVYAHWGEEYEEPPPRIKALAKQFIDAGAAIVVGSHPHIVQESEIYKGKYIYYSLGNFIFDQYFSDAVMHGLLLKVTFDNFGVVDVEELPTVFGYDRRPCLVQ